MILLFSVLLNFFQASVDTLTDKKIEKEIIQLISENDNSAYLLEEIEFYHENKIILKSASLKEIIKIPFLNETDAKLIIQMRDSVELKNFSQLKGIYKNDKLKKLILQYCTKIELSNENKIKVRSRIVSPMIESNLKDRNLNESKIYEKIYFQFQNYSAHILSFKNSSENYDLNNSYGFLTFENNILADKIVIGDFDVSGGEGLTFSKDSYNSISAGSISFNKTKNILNGHSSTSNKNFRGIGLELNLSKNISFSPFYSVKSRNGIFDEYNKVVIIDSKSSDAKRMLEKSSGFILSNVIGKHKINFNFLNVKYSNIISANVPYNFESDKLKIIGFNGENNYSFGKIYFDISKTNKNKKAYVVGFEADGNFISYSLHLRKYENGFMNPFANNYSQKSSIGGEEGIIFGIESQVAENSKIIAIVDDYKLIEKDEFNIFGRDYILKIESEFNEKISGYFLFKQNQIKKNYRFHLDYIFNSNFDVSERIEFIETETENGFLMFTDLNTDLIENKLNIILRAISFKTDSFNTRIYEFENDLPGNFGLNFLYGSGMKYYLLTDLKINPNHKLYFKISFLQKNQSVTANQFGLQYDLIF